MSHRTKNYIVFATILFSFFLALIFTVFVTFVIIEKLATTITTFITPIGLITIYLIIPITFALLYVKVGQHLSITRKYFRDATVTISITAVFFACGCQVMGFYVWHIYTTIPFPAPASEQYYNWEMEQYCVDQWEFVDTEISCDGYTKCRMAECEIPRPFVEDAQFFSVYLRSLSKDQTNVRFTQQTINP